MKPTLDEIIAFMERRKGYDLALVVKYKEDANEEELAKALGKYGMIEDDRAMIVSVASRHIHTHYKSLEEIKKDGPFLIMLSTKKDAEHLEHDYKQCKEGALSYVKGFDSFPTSF